METQILNVIIVEGNSYNILTYGCYIHSKISVNCAILCIYLVFHDLSIVLSACATSFHAKTLWYQIYQIVCYLYFALKLNVKHSFKGLL